MMTPFTSLTSAAVLLRGDDIDTDQVVPGRFLKGTSREGLAEALFADWRYDEKGHVKAAFALNRPEAKGAKVLVAGSNFGCGSSREHAPWALLAFGFRAIVARSFGDIFRNNALKNGLLPVIVDAETHRRIFESGGAPSSVVTARPLTIDLVSQTVRLDDGTVTTFAIDGFSKHCLLEGVDELGYLQSVSGHIARYEARHG